MLLSRRNRAFYFMAFALFFFASCKSERKPITVFAAASLARALADFEYDFEEAHSKRDIRVEISGSQTACRKLSELNRRADVVLTADFLVIDRILRPQHAKFSLIFAANEIVIAHMAHSKFTDEITQNNWPDVLLRPGVRLGTVDPDQAPIGYRTLLVWQLAKATLGRKDDLAAKLRQQCAKAHVTPHESELLELLQTQTIDYAFMYRSTAEEHRLKMVALPDSYNLGSVDHVKSYAKATVSVRMEGRKSRILNGAPVLYGATVPTNAEYAAGGTVFLRELLGSMGQRALKRTGFRPIIPVQCNGCAGIPAALRPLLQKSSAQKIAH